MSRTRSAPARTRPLRLRRGGLPAALGWIALFLPGCAYRLHLSSTPEPAQVLLPDGRVVRTPTDETFRWTLDNEQIVQVSAPGYRTFAVDLRDREIKLTRYIVGIFTRWGRGRDAPRGHVAFVLVPAHGPVGTWDPEEVD